MIQVVAEEKAEWVLRAVTPKRAVEEYGVGGLKGDHAFLLVADGRSRGAEPKQQNADSVSPESVFRRVYGRYPLSDAKALTIALQRDLPKVFRWQNVWRVVDGVNALDGGETRGVVLEVRTLEDANDAQGMPFEGVSVRSGQEMGFWVRNDGRQSLWVTALYLGDDLSMQVVFNQGVDVGKRSKVGQGTARLAERVAGVDGLVILAVPQEAVRAQPDYSLLAQEPLAAPDRAKGTNERGPKTPFGELLRHAAYGKGQRLLVPVAETTPAVVAQLWPVRPQFRTTHLRPRGICVKWDSKVLPKRRLPTGSFTAVSQPRLRVHAHLPEKESYPLTTLE